MSNFKDKYFSIIGDSASTYEGYLPEGYPAFYSYYNASGIYGYRETWWGQVLEHFGARLLVNNSYSGSYVSKPENCETESYGCSDKRCSGLASDGVSPDHIVVWMGLNDVGAGFPLTSADKSDLSVFENAYALMLDKIKHNYPNATIWCCTFPVFTYSQEICYESLESKLNNSRKVCGDIIKETAARKGCRVIDLFDKNALCDTVDGLHPNYQGMRMIANKVIAAMEIE